jgi:hypothetical protein
MFAANSAVSNFFACHRFFAACSLAVVVTAMAAACTDGESDPDGGEDVPTMDSAVVDENGLSPALVCPGARGCTSNAGALFVGAGARTITPVVETFTDTNANGVRDFDEDFVDENANGTWDGVWVAGFSMGRAATGVHDDLWARAVVLRQGDVSVGMVALDVVGFFHSDVMNVRRAVAARGLDLDHVIVASTHNHEAKDTMGIWGAGPSTTGYDEAYMAHIVDESVEALAQAIDGLREATLTVAVTDAPVLVADSRQPIVVDPAVRTLAFTADDGAPIAHVVVFGNHPEALGGDNTLLTSDYPHYLRTRLEETYVGTTAVFFAGTLGGLMNPLGVIGCPDADGLATCGNGDFQKASYIGDNLADLVITALAGGTVVENPRLGIKRLPFFTPATNEVLVLAFKLGLLRRHAYLKEDETLVSSAKLAEIDIAEIMRDYALGTEVNALSLGDVEIVTIPGELYPELWLVPEGGGSYVEHPEGADHPDAPAETPVMATMRQVSFPVVINNANDAIGYIIPKPQYDVTDPRAYKEDGQYGEQNSLGADTAPAVTEAAAAVSTLVVD